MSGSFQYLLLSIPQITGAETPNCLPIFAAEAVPFSDRMLSTSDGVSFLLRPGCSQGEPATVLLPLVDPKVQDLPKITELTVETVTPVASAISARDFTPSARCCFTDLIWSSVYFDCLGAFSAHRRPARAECATFSAGLTHSRFPTELFVLSKSLWFTLHLPSGGGPMNAKATNWWMNFADSFLYPFSSWWVYRIIRKYPLGSFTGLRSWAFSTPPLRPLRVQVSKALTRPKSLTSYRPSKPTTGFQFSTSIFTSFRGFAPSSRFLICRLISVLQGTARLPSVSALLELRRVGRPMFGAFPTLGLGCRS